MISRPLVTVCIPTFGQARWLAESLTSALGQTMNDLEVVVVDDASPDGTRRVMGAFRDPRVRYFRQPRTVGIAANRNACLNVARGRYVAWLDSDDVWEPSMLERQCALLDARPEVGLVHGGFRLIDAGGDPVRPWTPPHTADAIVPGRDAFRDLIVENHIVAPTVLVRRELHDAVGPYATTIGPSGTDWEMWLRISLRADVGFTAEPVARYRLHPESVSARTTRTGERLRCDRRAVRRVFALDGHRIPDADRLERRGHAALAVRALLAMGDAFARGRRGAALAAWLEALRAAPRLLLQAPTARLGRALAAGDEYATHVHGRRVLAALMPELEGTRLGERITPRIHRDAGWERSFERAAAVVRRMVPSDALVAAIDKHDPTLLRRSGRGGWHFPDLQSLPGYPPDSAAAIDHLEDLRCRGAGWLVVPRPAFWWLDHYPDFRRHLERVYQCRRDDPEVRLYQLASGEIGR